MTALKKNVSFSLLLENLYSQSTIFNKMLRFFYAFYIYLLSIHLLGLRYEIQSNQNRKHTSERHDGRSGPWTVSGNTLNSFSNLNKEISWSGFSQTPPGIQELGWQTVLHFSCIYFIPKLNVWKSSFVSCPFPGLGLILILSHTGHFLALKACILPGTIQVSPQLKPLSEWTGPSTLAVFSCLPCFVACHFPTE